MILTVRLSTVSIHETFVTIETGVIGSFLGLLAASSEHSVVNIGVSIFTTFLANVASLVAFLNYAFE